MNQVEIMQREKDKYHQIWKRITIWESDDRTSYQGN